MKADPQKKEWRRELKAERAAIRKADRELSTVSRNTNTAIRKADRELNAFERKTIKTINSLDRELAKARKRVATETKRHTRRIQILEGRLS